MDLAVDADLAEAPRNQLRHLAAEIDDEGAIVLAGVGVECHGERLDESGRPVTGGLPTPDHFRVGGNPERTQHWVPAFAGKIGVWGGLT
jgi:hypothetical protein